MNDDVAIQRCLKLVAALNQRRDWKLTPQVQQHYAQQIVICSPDILTITDKQLSERLGYYHTEHLLVENLLNPANPEHQATWEQTTNRIIRFLLSKTGGTIADQVAVSLEDMAYEAVQDVVRGLPSFCYKSKFETWVFVIASNCLARHYRSLSTQRHQGVTAEQSLDALLEVGDTIIADFAPEPVQDVLYHLLARQIQEVLARHQDRRLEVIFDLAMKDDLTLRDIGKRLNLSVGRVHTLLQQALSLLRDDPDIQNWDK